MDYAKVLYTPKDGISFIKFEFCIEVNVTRQLFALNKLATDDTSNMIHLFNFELPS